MTSIASYVVDLQLVPNSENSEVKNISISGHVQVFLQLSDNDTKLKYRVFIKPILLLLSYRESMLLTE